MTARGLRNRNPGNIVKGDDWLGLSDDQRGDDRFCVFEHEIFGIRALCKILLNYQKAHGLKTVRAMIERWAPPSENDTVAYVDDVARKMQVGPRQEVRLADDVVLLHRMAEAIIMHENGQQPYSDEMIAAGVALALL